MRIGERRVRCGGRKQGEKRVVERCLGVEV